MYARYFWRACTASSSRVPRGAMTPCATRKSRRRDSSHVENTSASMLAKAFWASAYFSSVHAFAVSQFDLTSACRSEVE